MTERFWARRGSYKYAGHACPCAEDARKARNADEAINGPITARRPAVLRGSWCETEPPEGRAELARLGASAAASQGHPKGVTLALYQQPAVHVDLQSIDIDLD